MGDSSETKSACEAWWGPWHCGAVFVTLNGLYKALAELTLLRESQNACLQWEPEFCSATKKGFQWIGQIGGYSSRILYLLICNRNCTRRYQCVPSGSSSEIVSIQFMTVLLILITSRENISYGSNSRLL